VLCGEVIIMVRRWTAARGPEPSGGINRDAEKPHPVRLARLAPGLPLLLFALIGACCLIQNDPEGLPATMRGVHECSATIVTMALAPDAATMAISDHSGMVHLWYPRFNRRRLFLDGQGMHVRCVALAPDGKTLAIGDLDSSVSVCDVSSGKTLWSATEHAGEIRTVAFSPDGTALATGGDDGVVYLWSTATHRLQARLTGHTQRVTAVVFAPGGRTLVSGSLDGTIRCWDAATYQARWAIPVSPGGVMPAVLCVRFSPDGKTIATSVDFDAYLRLWDSATGQGLMALRGDAGCIRAVDFAPDGTGLAVGDNRGYLTIWDLKSRRPRTSWNAGSGWIISVAFSADGRTLASAGERTVKLWEISADGRHRL
jgi:WD40 repeat protein